MLIAGIDEAGRGSLLGPLIVAGVSITKSKVIDLEKLGVRDSKSLTKQKREYLFPQILDVVDFTIIKKIDPFVIDQNVFVKRLNKLEGENMAFIIKNLSINKAYVDSCDVNPLRFKEFIVSILDNEIHKKNNIEIISEHHADKIHSVVSAASIIAKVTRDRELEKIEKIYGKIGSGYPSDNRTIKFVKNWIKKYNEPPIFARKSWKPIKQIMKNEIQMKLFDYTDKVE